MKIVHGVKNLPKSLKNLVVTIGNFDGVHLGHQKLLQTLLEEKRKIRESSLILTFHPHPQEFLRPQSSFKKINTYEERLELLRGKGIDFLVEEKFDEKFSNISREDFVQNILIEKLNAKVLILGHDFVFGKDRKGNVSYLKESLSKNNVSIYQLEAILDESKNIISSSNIRKYILNGDMEKANKQLKRSFFISGKVVKGKDRGKKITGFPTANINIPKQIIHPKYGVYISQIFIKNKLFNSISNIGVQPSFSYSKAILETHIFNFKEDCYGEEARIFFLSFLREEKKFNSSDDLTGQIKEDILKAKEYNYKENIPTY